MNNEQTFYYHKYIDTIIDKFEEELISGEKVQQFLNTLQLWENRFKRLSLAKKEVTLIVLQNN